MGLKGFDAEEFNKDYRNIDFEKLAKSIKAVTDNMGEWGLPKGKQGAKTGIQKLLLNKGSVFELGSSN